MGAGDLATVFLVPSAGEKFDESGAGALVRLCQSNNVAALVADDIDLASRTGADGIHVTWTPDVSDRFRRVRGAIGRDRVAGGDAGLVRHDAMELGEAGADYVTFAIPPEGEDREAAVARCLELVAWWAEIFEVPVVAFGAKDAAEAHALASAGADFVVASFPGNLTPDGVADWMGSLYAAICVAR